jgi:hypothetical protein
MVCFRIKTQASNKKSIVCQNKMNG